MSDWDEPDTMAMMRKVDAAFSTLKAAERRLGRVRKPEAKAAARLAYEEADDAYRRVCNERDEFAAIRRAQRTQGRIAPIKVTGKLFPRTARGDE